MAATLIASIRRLADSTDASVTPIPSENRQQEIAKIIGANNQAIRDYENRYEADAVVLRDEMLARLPLVQRPDTANFLYEQPTNAYGLRAIAEDLQKLSILLPLN
jgi:hypothetical protein